MTELEKLMYLAIKESQSGEYFECNKCPLKNLCLYVDESECFYDILTELNNRESILTDS